MEWLTHRMNVLLFVLKVKLIEYSCQSYQIIYETKQ